MNIYRELDLTVSCSDCKAGIGVDCITGADAVCWQRRLDRLLKERGATKDDLVNAIRNDKPLKGNSS